jgi:hypothetical protein
MPKRDDPAADLAAAQAEAAELVAEKARLELQEWKSPVAAANRAANQRADTAKAEKSIMDSTFGQFAGAFPDLSKINPGSTTVGSGTQLFASALALHALDSACREAAGKIAAKIPDKNKYVLITTEADLASTDGMYAQVAKVLTQLQLTASQLIDRYRQPAPQGRTDGDTRAHRESFALAGVGALASAVPAVISLFSANRTVAGASTKADDLQAVIGVAAAMADQVPPLKVLVDDFRTVDQKGPIEILLDKVNASRVALAGLKDELTASTTPADVQALGQVNQVASVIDTFVGSILAIPSGGTRSAYTGAILRERIHNQTIDCVVLIKGVSGSTAQVINDRPLWFKDKFTTVASAGLSWLIVRTSDGAVAGGGSQVSSMQLSGTIGGSIEVTSATRLSA